MPQTKRTKQEFCITVLPVDTLFHACEYIDPSTLHYSLPFVSRYFRSVLKTRISSETTSDEFFNEMSCTYENVLWRNFSPAFEYFSAANHLYSFRKLYIVRYGIVKLQFAHRTHYAALC